MQQAQNYLLLPDAAVKQEPRSPNYVDLLNTSTTPPPPASSSQRYTPSPNPLHTHSISPNIPVQGMQQYDMLNYIPTVSPLQNANLLNQQYQQQPQPQGAQNQFNIPNTIMVNAAVNFMNTTTTANNSNTSTQNHLNPNEQRNIEDILTNNNLTNMNQLDGMTNAENVLDNDSSMNISSLLDLDSQQQINSSNLLLSNDMLNDLIKNLDNGMDQSQNQGAIPITINSIETNNLDADEENMTDSFKQISIE